jgi:mannosyltransferase OCH1-like enzyme
LNPDYSISYFSNNKCELFIKENFKKNVLNAYKKLKPSSYKADLFRYCALYKRGGIYTDNGVKYIKPFDEIYPENKNSLYIFQDLPQRHTQNSGLQIACMCVNCKNHPFLKILINKCLENIKNNLYGNSPLSITGPTMAYNEYIKYRNHNYPVYIIGKLSSRRNSNLCRSEFNHNIVNNKNQIISCWKSNDYYKTHKKINNANYGSLWWKRDVYH